MASKENAHSSFSQSNCMFHENFLKKKKVSNFFRRKYPTVCIQRAKNNSKKKKNLDKDSYLSEKMKTVSVNDERRKRE